MGNGSIRSFIVATLGASRPGWPPKWCLRLSEHFRTFRAAPDTTAEIPQPSALSAPHPRLIVRNWQLVQGRRWLHQFGRQRWERWALRRNYLGRRCARAEEHGQSTIGTSACGRSTAAWRGTTSNMREIRPRITAERMPRQRWRCGPRVWGCGKTCPLLHRGSVGIKSEGLSLRAVRLD